jgi:VanZ family protein
MKWLTLAFSLFVFGVIVAVDAGYLRAQVRLVHSIPLGDKIAHFLLIGILGFLISLMAIRSQPDSQKKRTALLSGLTLIVIFSLEEASQSMFPGRNPSLADLLADCVGIALGACLALNVNTKRGSESTPAKHVGKS